MSERHEAWEARAPEWRKALEQALSDFDGDGGIPGRYSDLAYAFPSRTPAEWTWEHPMADVDQLKDWAQERGWRVEIVDGESTAKLKAPVIRFWRTE